MHFTFIKKSQSLTVLYFCSINNHISKTQQSGSAERHTELQRILGNSIYVGYEMWKLYKIMQTKAGYCWLREINGDIIGRCWQLHLERAGLFRHLSKKTHCRNCQRCVLAIQCQQFKVNIISSSAVTLKKRLKGRCIITCKYHEEIHIANSMLHKDTRSIKRSIKRC